MPSIKSLQQVIPILINLYVIQCLPADQYFFNEGRTVPEQEFFNYQPRTVIYYPNDINKPVIDPQLGMSPQYHELVYQYVKDFAGTEQPTHVNTVSPNLFYKQNQYVSSQNVPENLETVSNGKPAAFDKFGGQEPITDKPGLKDYYIPSDLFTLNNHPSSQFYGSIDAIKMKRMHPKARPTSLPPLGGVVSNYALLRNQPNHQNLLLLPGTKEANLQHIKRQTADDSDGVVILAEPVQNAKASEENDQGKEEEEESSNKEEGQEMQINPGIAQSKPSAIALAGPGGMAQASPVGTALVGQGGLAVAAPSGTAVAGPAGQGAIPIQIGGEKQKTTEKSEE